MRIHCSLSSVEVKLLSTSDWQLLLCVRMFAYIIVVRTKRAKTEDILVLLKPAVTDFFGHLGAAKISRKHNTANLLANSYTSSRYSEVPAAIERREMRG